MIIVLSLDVAKRFNNPLKDLENLINFYEYNLTYSMSTKLEKIFHELLKRNLEIKKEIINVINNNFEDNFNFKKISEVKDLIRNLHRQKDYMEFVKSELDYGVPNYIKVQERKRELNY